MAMHLEFVVVGIPISNQATGTKGKANLTAWMAKVEKEFKKVWKKVPLKGEVKVITINFYQGNKPSVDVDNMSKPIHDALNNFAYDDDRQITQAEISHVRINAPMSFAGASKILVDAVQKAQPFVYIRIEDPSDPFPLPM